jgi:hypothetical protein
MALAMAGQKDLGEVPRVTWLSASTPQLVGIIVPTLPPPWADGGMGDVATALAHQVLPLARAQGEAGGEPDPMTDHLAGKAVMFVTLGGGGRGHVCLSILIGGW